jgi:VWFA-related protein
MLRWLGMPGSALLLSGFLFASASPPPQIAVRVDLVTVPVTVTGSHGEFVGGLERKNFRLLVDGAEQPIEYFTPEQEPAQVLLLVETGPAVYLLRREHIFAAAELLGNLAPGDRIAVANYSDAPGLLMGFTPDRRAAVAALQEMSYGLGNAQLNFYDSLALAVDWLKTEAGKQAIVVLTTGLDSSPAGRWELLDEKLQHSNVLVLPVALGGELRGDKRKNAATKNVGTLSFAESDRALEAIAAATGGYAFFPRTERDYQDAYLRIAALLGHEYNLGFAAQQQDARYHAISVEVVDDQGRVFNGKDRKPEYRVNTRRGFLASPP